MLSVIPTKSVPDLPVPRQTGIGYREAGIHDFFWIPDKDFGYDSGVPPGTTVGISGYDGGIHDQPVPPYSIRSRPPKTELYGIQYPRPAGSPYTI